MANQKVLAIVFAITVATVDAATGNEKDKCEQVDTNWELNRAVVTAKTLATTLCVSDKTTCDSPTKCASCGGACCELKKNTCEYASKAGQVCPGGDGATGKWYDATKRKSAVKADYSDFQTVCCTQAATNCNSVQCVAKKGYKNKATKSTVKCANVQSCGTLDCCDLVIDNCYWGMNTKAQTCSAGKYMVESKWATAIKNDVSDFDTQCCATQKKCDITCPAGYKDKAGKTAITCASGVCDKTECCDLDTTKCLGAVTGATGAGKGCVAGTHVYNAAKDGIAVKADYTDFITNCCIKRTNCDTFNKTFMTPAQIQAANAANASASRRGSTSATIQQTSTVFLVALGAIIALFK